MEFSNGMQLLTARHWGKKKTLVWNPENLKHIIVQLYKVPVKLLGTYSVFIKQSNLKSLKSKSPKVSKSEIPPIIQ